jgi:hypothetical protein
MASIREGEIKVGTYLLYERHKIVADGMYTGFGYIGKGLFVTIHHFIGLSTIVFDGFMYGECFDDFPSESEGFNVLFKASYLYVFPNLSAWNMVKRRGYGLHSDLSEHS